MKDFPDAYNFVKIMNVILVEEDLTSTFNIQELVATSDGFRQWLEGWYITTLREIMYLKVGIYRNNFACDTYHICKYGDSNGVLDISNKVNMYLLLPF